MNLETLQQKHAVLVAQKDQILANLNASIGAISMMDELIGAELAEQSKAAASASEPEVNFTPVQLTSADLEPLDAGGVASEAFEKAAVSAIAKNRRRDPGAR